MDAIQKGHNDLGQFIAIKIDKNVYSICAIMKTCYTLTDDYYMHVTNPTPEQYVVYLYAMSPVPADDEIHILAVQRFLQELYDNQLRKILIAETQQIHEVIVKKAFEPAINLVVEDIKTDPLIL